METKKFEIPEVDFSTIARTGHAHIGIKIHGYWSGDPISIYLSRSWVQKGESPNWDIKLSHSAGGRDSKEVEDDLDAECNFGEALIAAAAFAREIRANRILEIEASYQKYIEEIKEHERKQEEEKQKKIDADPAFGYSEAEYLLSVMKATAKAKGSARAKVFARGMDKPWNFTAIASPYSGRVSFRTVSGRVGYQDALKMVSQASHRTELIAQVAA